MENAAQKVTAGQVTAAKKSGVIRRVLLSCVLSALGIVFALLLIEIIFRLLPSHSAPQWQDRPLAYFYPEGAQTLQDYNYPAKKPAGALRIAAVGDSFTFGPFMQFDDAFPKRMERWLNLNQNQPKVEVINYGVPRYSTYHEVSVVKQALREKADLVLMQVTLNDPEIKLLWPTGLLPGKSGEMTVSGGIFDYWKSLAFVVTRIKNRESQNAYKQYFFDLFERNDTWDKFSVSWKKIAAMCARRNVPVVAVIFPLFGMPVDDTYPFFPLDQKVAELLQTLGIPHLDITNEYRNIPVDRLQVLPVADRHPNEIGHRIAAEAIMRWLPSTHTLPDTIFPKGSVPSRVGIKIENTQ